MLVAVGLPAKLANGTSTVALLRASLGGALAPLQRAFSPARRELTTFGLTSLVGGGLGDSWPGPLHVVAQTFEKLVPGLILFATLLFALRGRFKGLSDTAASSPMRTLGTVVFQFVVGVYGGYFGAGIGILMLAALAFLRHV